MNTSLNTVGILIKPPTVQALLGKLFNSSDPQFSFSKIYFFKELFMCVQVPWEVRRGNQIP